MNVHLGAFELEPNDKIVLASDGLTSFVRDDVIFEICSDGDAYSNASDLLELALNAGGEDNISIAVIEFA